MRVSVGKYYSSFSEIYSWIELNSFPFYFCLYLWCLHSWENSVLVMSIYHNNSITFFFYIFFIFQVNNTKGCTKCCVGRNPYNGYKYLCGSTPTGVFLMQWYVWTINNEIIAIILLQFLSLLQVWSSE